MKFSSCPYCDSKKLNIVSSRSDKVNILKCSECGLMFVEKYPKDISNLYQKKYYFNEENSSIGYTDYNDNINNTLFLKNSFYKQVSTNNNNVLDIGCGLGNFLDLIETKHKFGVEISDHSIDICKGKNINNVYRYEEGLKFFKEESFDVVTCFDTLEHMTNLNVVKTIKRILKKNGSFIFSTLMINDINKTSWFSTSLEHILYFSENFLDKLIENEFSNKHIYKYKSNKLETIYYIVTNKKLKTSDLFDGIINLYTRDITTHKKIQTKDKAMLMALKASLKKEYIKSARILSKIYTSTNFHDFLYKELTLHNYKNLYINTLFEKQQWIKASKKQDILIQERDQYIKQLEDNIQKFKKNK